MNIDRSEIKQLVRDLRAEGTSYGKLWTTWLGIASGGGAVALLSFAANLPDPDFALRALLPALAAFICGVCFSGLSVLTAALRIGAAEVHHGAAFTRDELGDAIKQMRLVIASPPSMADEMNRERNQAIRLHDEHDVKAQAAWASYVRWKFLNRMLLCLAALSFLTGIVAPLVHITAGLRYTPANTLTKVH